MVSYTDSRDTKDFHAIKKKYGEESLGKHIQNLLKKMFQNMAIKSIVKNMMKIYNRWLFITIIVILLY